MNTVARIKQATGVDILTGDHGDIAEGEHCDVHIEAGFVVNGYGDRFAINVHYTGETQPSDDYDARNMTLARSLRAVADEIEAKHGT